MRLSLEEQNYNRLVIFHFYLNISYLHLEDIALFL